MVTYRQTVSSNRWKSRDGQYRGERKPLINNNWNIRLEWFNITDYNKYIGKQYGKLKILKVERDYENKITYATAECDCGNVIKARLGLITSGDKKSCGCLKHGVKRMQSNNIIDLSGFKIGKITVTESSNRRASNGSIMWNYKCECGNTGIACGTDIRRGQILSCGCSKVESRPSKYEITVENFLKSKNIKYNREFRFDDCRNKNPLPFDFYLPDFNTCIECQGQQHYYPIEHFGGVENYNKIILRDKIKKEYCEKNSIKLLYIPYTLNEDEIQLLLLKKLTP